MGALTPIHLIMILAVALLVIGPGKLPETGAALGKAIRQFRDATDGRLDDAPTTVVPPSAPTDPAADRDAPGRPTA
jgi:sec-independent protein translocase protein TatA